MNKGKIVIISLVLVFLGLIAFLVYQLSYKKIKYLYLFTGNSEIVRWYYNNDTWYTANNNSILKEKFDVYSDGNNIGSYYLVYSDRWYFFDDNNQSNNIIGDYMINTNFEFNSFSIKSNNIDNQNIINKLKKRFTTSDDEYEVVLNEIEIDNTSFNKLYVASFTKISNDYEVNGPTYSAIFTYNKNKISFIKEFNFLENNLSSKRCYLDLDGVFTFENKNIKILISCKHYDEIPNDYYLFEKRGSQYKLLINSLGGVN